MGGDTQPVSGKHRRAFNERLWDRVVGHDDTALDDAPDEVVEALPSNGLRQILAMALQKMGDVIVDAKTVLAWLVTHLGGPGIVLALLVPVRESGSLLPQSLMLPAVRSRRRRTWVWVAGAIGQAVSVAGMAMVAAFGSTAAAAWSILGLLASFAVARALSSIASKDVMGRTVPKGMRGRISGTATAASGLVALTLGVGLRFIDVERTPGTTMAWLLSAAAAAWLLAALVYSAIHEPVRSDEPSPSSPQRKDPGSLGALALLRTDRVFRRFVAARSLLLVSALSPPFVVAIAAHHGADGLADLGAFVVAAGVAAIIGGRLWGRAADQSSRSTMAWSALLASATIIVFLALLQIPSVRDVAWLYPATHFALSLIHTGSRLGRKTYLVDLAEGDDRTTRVAVSNTAIGIVLLIAGAVTGMTAAISNQAALGLLAALGCVGVVISLRLPEVSAGG
ncbi:MAG: hypothetical protein WD358_03950 [Nitriliruptoraceae bacterium]